MSDMSPYLERKDEEKASELSDSENSDSEDWDVPKCFDQPWHTEPIKGDDREEHSWRVKEKYKTHCVALVLCLNVGVDPPDVVKTQPCARAECWIDPLALSPSKALESIGHALQSQYERWQPRARYKHSLDPTSEEVKKLCCSLRRNAKDERVLFHYNGHGVPKPTAQGEIWVFNRTYTQYIPLSMYDLQTWMGAPSLYVYDCSNAGVIVDNFKTFAEQHEREAAAAAGEGGAAAGVSYRSCIQLAACAAGQALPMNPELPADVFTACLTTPVKMAVKWFALRTATRVCPPDILDLVDKIPGQVTDRRTMLGELNWIFTAVTDTIAWSSLPPELFSQLFRADLLTASLCRNFLLADRLMRSYNCTPVSWPALPSLARHPLWEAWEHTLDLALAQLPALLRPAPPPYRPAAFFRDQLSAFHVWLQLGRSARGQPAQLPMVLQVLLSTLHRLRALRLLARFVALGGWAARAVLDVGICPYMLKLLQAHAPELRAPITHIWARALTQAKPQATRASWSGTALYGAILNPQSCQVDLVNAKGHKYFLAILQDPTVDSELRTLAAYILAAIADDYPPGQEACLQGSMISACLEQLNDESATARAWACIALARLFRGYPAARMAAARDLAHEKLCPLLLHRSPTLRAAAAHALAGLLHAGAGAARADHDHALDQHVGSTLAARLPLDASALVRHQLLAALQWIVLIFEQQFIAVYLQEKLHRPDKERGSRGAVDRGQDALVLGRSPPAALPAVSPHSLYSCVWRRLGELARDPQPATAAHAQALRAHVAAQAESVESGAGSDGDAPTPRRHLAGRRARAVSSEEGGSPAQRDSASSVGSQPASKKAIISTQFAEWMAARYMRGSEPPDDEARAAHELAWRRARNRRLRHLHAETVTSGSWRPDSQVFTARCLLPPTALAFHHYDQQLCVATRDHLHTWDWGTGARLHSAGWARAGGRVCDVAALPGGLLAAAGAHGALAVYRAATLLHAHRALDVQPAREPRPPRAMPSYSLTQLVTEQFGDDLRQRLNPNDVLNAAGGGGGVEGSLRACMVAWQARRRLLCVAGRAPLLRLWDPASELLHADVPLECCAAGSVSCARSLVVVGLADGAARAWDVRGAAAWSVRPDAAPAVAAALQPRRHALTVINNSGLITVWDERSLAAPLHTGRAGSTVWLGAVHAASGAVACAGSAQAVWLHDARAAPLPAISHQEGFMAARIPPPAALAFHPLRCALAVGGKDATVSVYVSEPRR